MKKLNVTIIAFLFTILVGCKSKEPTEPAGPVKNPEWINGKITQPVPSWGSSTKLQLPVQVNQIIFGPAGGIGGFGSHQGGHIEGLDHVWIEVESGIPIRSWASGQVKKIENMGGEYFITIEYAGGLTGKHMEVKTPLVAVGNYVNAGDPVCYGLSFGGAQSAEFMLNDKNRNDGVTAQSDGSYVSPFDYLQPAIKDSLENVYRRKVIEPYLSAGKDAGNNHPVEPYLTNPVLFHKSFKGTVAGEWLLTSKWELGGYPDILTLLDVQNEFYSGKKILAADNKSEGQTVFNGTWSAELENHHLTFSTNGITYYALYELDESGDRAKLKLEYSTTGYPSKFSSVAAIYIERGTSPRKVDADNLGIPN